MRVFNEDKTEELVEYDLRVGKLVEDTLITHHDAIVAVPEEAHYVVVREYDNGGKDLEKVIDVPEVIGQDAYDEEEEIMRYIPFDENEMQKKAVDDEIFEIEEWFSWYDTQVIQYGRAARRGESFDRDIVELDNIARQKAVRIKELKQLLEGNEP